MHPGLSVEHPHPGVSTLRRAPILGGNTSSLVRRLEIVVRLLVVVSGTRGLPAAGWLSCLYIFLKLEVEIISAVALPALVGFLSAVGLCLLSPCCVLSALGWGCCV